MEFPRMHTHPNQEFGVMDGDGVVRMTFADQTTARRIADNGDERTAVRFVYGEWMPLDEVEAEVALRVGPQGCICGNLVKSLADGTLEFDGDCRSFGCDPACQFCSLPEDES